MLCCICGLQTKVHRVAVAKNRWPISHCAYSWCPRGVNRVPLRPLRVGITQSIISTPRSIASEYIYRRADTHEIARTVGGQNLVGYLSIMESHHLGRLAYSQATYGITVGTKRGRMSGSFAPHVGGRYIPGLWGSSSDIVAVQRFCLAVMPPSALKPAFGEVEASDAHTRGRQYRRVHSSRPSVCRPYGALDIDHVLGVNRCRDPSMWLRKCAPSSVSLRFADNENT